MKTRRQKLLEDENRRPLIVKSIPVDLIIEILSRLPTKSIARCRCVSKLWSSIFVQTCFTDLVLARSVARPKLLLVCKNNDGGLVFTSPQPQNPDENSSPIVADYQMIFPFDVYIRKVYRPVQGLICFETMRILEKQRSTVLVICNPSTGQSLTLPRVNTECVLVMSFFGYDPIEKQFKVLSMASPGKAYNMLCCVEHYVMTLGTTGEPIWRMIECSTPHYPLCDGICINGVLYYLARPKRFEMNYRIVCFDIRSETFKFIEKGNWERVSLVNYKGKLATFRSDDEDDAVFGTSISFELCVLEDAEKHEWTTHTCVLPPLWKECIIRDVKLCIIGVTRRGEIVLYPYFPRGFTYLIYYNLERNAILKVEIQGIDGFMYDKVEAFLDHVEDVKLGGVFRTP